MLKLIPATIGPEYKSDAEKKVFNLLKECSCEGYAFHSVGLPKHEKKSYSEADFIVVTRNGVLCLEVKGGRVSCENGVWAFENRYGNIDYKNEGPFEQAAGALFALKKVLTEKLPWISKASFATGVVFTDITFDYEGVSIIPEIKFDYSSTMQFGKYMEKCHAYWDSRKHSRCSYLTSDEIEQIKGIIRDDMHFVPSLNCIANSIEYSLIRLTQEQISIIDALEDNKKILVNGPAGSGKTLLALEYGKRCAAQNKRVLFLTYNKLLAHFLANLNTDENIVIKYFHGLISEYVALNPTKMSEPSYFTNVLPNKFLELLSSNRIAQYDVLIIDEGQDLFNITYFNIFDKLLKKGLYNGQWMFFYDINQNLFSGGKFEKSLEALKKYNPINFKLTKNCRNTEPIAKFNKYVSGIEPGKTTVCGEQVEVLGYSGTEVNDIVDRTIDKLLGSGLALNEIIVLSPYTLEKSVLSNYNGKYDLGKFTGIRSSDKLNFSTIQAFKGLDSKIVVAVDLENMVDSKRSITLYTLISRARAMLYIISEESGVNKINMKLLENIVAD